MPATFVDTNVFVYVVDDDEPVKQQRARAALDEAMRGGLVLSGQILGEFYVTVTRKLRRPLDPDAAYEALHWLGQFKVITIDNDLVRSAARASRIAQVSYWDGLVLVAAATGGCDRVLTEDLNDGQLYGSVRVENPFRELTPG
jgi:predicted nucleic acid-binding protein